MIKKQLEILTSQYAALYDLIIPKDHMLRRINEEIDFSIIEDELINSTVWIMEETQFLQCV